MSNLANPIDWDNCQGVRLNNLSSETSYMHHAGMVEPKFAVTDIWGLGLVKPKIRVLFEKRP
jgi:hypothetical protein